MSPGVAVLSQDHALHHCQNTQIDGMGQPLVAQATSNSNGSFFQVFSSSIRPRITQLLAVFGGQEVAKNLVIGQVWTYLPVLTENKQLLKAEEVCLIGAPELQEFHSLCTYEGVPLTQLGPMGKVWESGVVQVVQNAENLSTESHPCNRLRGDLAKRIGEIVYLPVYDCNPNNSTKGVVAVIELMMNPLSQDVMVVANVISTVSMIMESVQLSLSQQPAAALQPYNTSNKPQPVSVAPGLPKICEGEVATPTISSISSAMHHQTSTATAMTTDAVGQNWGSGSSWSTQASPRSLGMNRTTSLHSLHHC